MMTEVSRASALSSVILWTCLASVAWGTGLGCTSSATRWRERAAGYERAGQLEQALEAARRSVEADPGDASARVLLGRLEARSGHPGATLRQLDAAVALGA